MSDVSPSTAISTKPLSARDRYIVLVCAFLGWFCAGFHLSMLCLPELFPTRVRSIGAGVSFNFGRILTAVTIFTTGALTELFGGDYARIGRVTSLIFLCGMLAACFAPDTSKRQLED